METRQVTEIKIWKLVLNPMRSNAENSMVMAISDDRDKLINYYNSHLVEPYSDNGSPSFECHVDSHNWHKTFRKGSELEWLNPTDLENVNSFGQGISFEWVNEGNLDNAKRNFLFL